MSKKYFLKNALSLHDYWIIDWHWYGHMWASSLMILTMVKSELKIQITDLLKKMTNLCFVALITSWIYSCVNIYTLLHYTTLIIKCILWTQMNDNN